MLPEECDEFKILTHPHTDTSMKDPRLWGPITALQARSFDERCHPSLHVREIDKKAEDGSGGAASFFPMGLLGRKRGKGSGHKHHASEVGRRGRRGRRGRGCNFPTQETNFWMAQHQRDGEKEGARLKARVEVVKLMMSRDVGKIADAL